MSLDWATFSVARMSLQWLELICSTRRLSLAARHFQNSSSSCGPSLSFSSLSWSLSRMSSWMTVIHCSRHLSNLTTFLAAVSGVQSLCLCLLFLSLLVVEETDGVLESVDGCDLPWKLSDQRRLGHNLLRHPERAGEGPQAGQDFLPHLVAQQGGAGVSETSQ